jgi:hypothetical protein
MLALQKGFVLEEAFKLVKWRDKPLKEKRSETKALPVPRGSNARRLETAAA